MGTEESQEWDFSGRVQGEGLISRLDTRPLVCRALSARSVDASEARFSASNDKVKLTANLKAVRVKVKR